MKCDICGKEFDEYEDIYTFTKNGEEINSCEACILSRRDDVEDTIAKRCAN